MFDPPVILSEDPPHPTGWPWPLDGVQWWFEELKRTVLEAPVNALRSFWASVYEKVRPVIGEALDLLDKQFRDVPEPWKTIAKAICLPSAVIYTIFKPTFAELYRRVEVLGKRVWDLLPPWLKEAIQEAHHILLNFRDRLRQFLTDPVGFLKGGFAWVISEGEKRFSWVGKQISSGVSWLGGEIRTRVEWSVSTIRTAFDGAVKSILEGFVPALRGTFEWLWKGAVWLVQTTAGFIFTLGERIGPVFSGFLKGLYDKLTVALRPGSLETELKVSVESATVEFYDFVEREVSKAYGTKLILAALPGVATTIVAGAMTAYTGLRAAATAADCAHPAKNIGFSRIVDDMSRMIGLAWLAGAPVIAMAEIGLMRPLRYYYNIVFAPWIPEPRDVINHATSRVISTGKYYELMRMHGYDEEHASDYLAASWSAPTFSEAREMLWRGKITPEKLAECLRYQKVREDFITGYEALVRSIPSVSDAVDMRSSRVIGDTLYYVLMKQHGYDEATADDYLAATWRVPTFSEAREMYWRGAISLTQLGDSLKHMKIREEFLAAYEMLIERIPGPGDLIRFVVREVITYDEFYEWMAKQGYTLYFAECYWRAHWVLPPPERTWDAYLRGVISEDSYRKFLIWYDYSPDPRPGIEVSDVEIMLRTQYELPGRIDMRWMYEWGHIDKETYRQLVTMRGMDPDWIDKVVDAETSNVMREEIMGLIREAIVDRRDGWITDEEMRSRLDALRIPVERIDYYLERAKSMYAREVREEQLRIYERQFKAGVLIEDEARSRLRELGLAEERIEQKIVLWRLGISAKPKVVKLKPDEEYIWGILSAAGFTADDILFAELEELKSLARELGVTWRFLIRMATKLKGLEVAA